MEKLANSVENQKEFLQKLKEERERTELELTQNNMMMQQKVQSLVDERQFVE